MQPQVQPHQPHDIDADMVRACIRNAHVRLEVVVKAEGVYIEEKCFFYNFQ